MLLIHYFISEFIRKVLIKSILQKIMFSHIIIKFKHKFSVQNIVLLDTTIITWLPHTQGIQGNSGNFDSFF